METAIVVVVLIGWLAKTDSWWARDRYLPLEDPERPSSYSKVARSIERYENRPWPLRQISKEATR